MSEVAEQASQRQRRANWLGLRTLRQRPKVVGSLPDGEPVYEVRSVRLVLQGQAPYFSRLVDCERCGRAQVGMPVSNLADLAVPPRPVICNDCVRKAGVSSVWDQSTVVIPAGPAALEPARTRSEPLPAASAAAVEPEPLGMDLQALAASVEDLAAQAREQRRAEEDQRRDTESTLMVVRAALAEGLEELRAEVRLLAEESAARMTTLEADVRHLSAATEVQGAEQHARLADITDTRAWLQRVTDATHQLALGQERIEGEASAVARQTASSSADALSRLKSTLDRRLDELLGQLNHAASRLDWIEARLDRMVILAPAEHAQPVGGVGGADTQGAGQEADLLDALDLQLQRAGQRLAALSSDLTRPAAPPRISDPELPSEAEEPRVVGTDS